MTFKQRNNCSFDCSDWEKFHIQTGSDGDESILKIDSAVPSDAGYYNCNKQDLFYVVVEPPIELTIMDESNRTLGPVVNLTVDQSVSFICHGSLHENSTIDADRVILEWIYETGEIIPNANYTSWTNIEVGEKNMSGTHYYCQLNFNATIDYNATDLICRFAEDDLELASGSIRLEFVSDKVRVNRYGFEFGIGVILLAGVSGTVSCYIIYKKRHNRITFVE